MKKKLFLLFTVAALFPLSAHACTIPVFRYALEKWDLASYEILVYHHGPLPADVQKSLDQWSKPGKVNVDITVIDLNSKDASNLANNRVNLWRNEAGNEKAPWMTVRYHQPRRPVLTAWSGPCTVASIDNLLDSPVRQVLLAQLTRGASGVYVFMTSGDEKKDKEGYDLVQAQLASLEKKIKLVPLSKEGPQIGWPIPLKVWLPILVLDHRKPEEAALVRLLMNTAPELELGKGPIVFAVFGRGRVLPGITGEDLTENVLYEVTEFLCGPCGCDVKAANPGIDLLLAADYKVIADKLFDGKEAVPMPEGVFHVLPNAKPVEAPVAPRGVAPTPSPVIEAPAAETVAKVECCDCPIRQNWLWIATGLAAALVLGTGAWLCYSLRK